MNYSLHSLGLKPRQFDTDGQPIEEPVLTDTKPANPRWITAQLISHLNGRRTLARLAKEEEQPELQDDADIPRQRERSAKIKLKIKKTDFEN